MKRLLQIGTAICTLTILAGAISTTGCSSTSHRRSAGRTMDDAGLTSRVKTDLLADPIVKGTDINVDTYNAQVQLNGWVVSQEQKDRAEQIAKSVSGVQSVKNNLQIKGEAAGTGQ